MATLGVGAALTAGAWTLSVAAVAPAADPTAIPVVGTSQVLVADPAPTDPARAVADAEARLSAINGRLQALAVQPAPTGSAAAEPAAAAPTAAAPTATAPSAHIVTGASGSANAGGKDAGTEGEREEQDD